VTATATPGTYTSLFTGANVGTASTLKTTINGVVLNSAPTVTVTGTAPTITLNPTSQTMNVGTKVTFNAAASGTPAPTVQWQLSAAGGTFTNITGATSTTYSLTVAATDNGDQFRAVFTNGAGQSITTVATLKTTDGMIIGSGHQLVVGAGQTVTGVTVGSGGSLLVRAGGTDVATNNQGGVETVQAGGQSTRAMIHAGGDMEIFGSASGTVLYRGRINVSAGGAITNARDVSDSMTIANNAKALNTTISTGASATVLSGGVATGTVLSGGTEWIRAGAISNGPTVNKGGLEYIFAGGVANGVTLNYGGTASIYGKVNGSTINPAGILTVDDGGVAVGSVVDNGAFNFQLSTTETFGGQLNGAGTLGVQGTGKLVVSSALNNKVSISVGNSSSLELQAASNNAIAFGLQSTLKLDDSLGFSGTLAATPGSQDVIDLGDIPFLANVTTVQFVENSAHTQGVLTVSDAASAGPTVHLVLLGDFSTATFTIAADGAATSENPHPGTRITGPF
jgi:autotransporter passenger strand-loop-strand repeat protein